MDRKTWLPRRWKRVVCGHVLRMPANLKPFVEVYLYSELLSLENQIAVPCWMSAISVAPA